MYINNNNSKILTVYSSTDDIVYGQAVYFSNIKAEEKLLNKIVIVDGIDVNEAMELLKLAPIGVLAKTGSFAGHSAGLLNGKSIPLFILKEGEIPSEGMFLKVDGKTGICEISITEFKQTESSDGYITDIPEVYPHKYFYDSEEVKILVDGKNGDELSKGIRLGANGIGTLKTEWLNWEKPEFPTRTEHFQVYEDCQAKIGENLLIIRLFDLGGDKVPLWASHVQELLKSPLGYRGIRGHTLLFDAFQEQLAAISAFSKNNKIGIVIPMVTHATEIKIILDRLTNLRDTQLRNITIGSMIETPSSVFELDELTQVCDFFRIGTGDLSQFTLATLRENILPKDFSKYGLSKPVMDLIAIAVTKLRKHKKGVNICLDFIPNESFMAQLLEMGIRDFCLPADNIKIALTCLDKICKDC